MKQEDIQTFHIGFLMIWYIQWKSYKIITLILLFVCIDVDNYLVGHLN